MESPLASSATKEFQVAGVSRSGRVRKKSSKLLDFESPEELEKRFKRTGRAPARYTNRGRPSNAAREREQEMSLAYEDDFTDVDNTLHLSAPEDTRAIINAADLRGTIMNSDDEVDTLVQDIVQGVQAEACYTNDSRVRQSLYMREKSNKRKILKDGKVVTGKMQRKDKGKSRYTAYSLWAREVRKRDFPDLDFANAARRLSELWANVSNKDKNAWRRKAKVQATKAKTREKEIVVTSMLNLASNGNAAGAADNTDGSFQVRPTTSRTKKIAADRRQVNEPVTPTQNRQRRNTYTRTRPSPAATATVTRQSAGATDLELAGRRSPPSSTEAIDAAAHLKLLGESLTLIGERLKEHNGHVALSGSLSVLLDSLLCSMGPLLCLATQIPGLENKPELATNLASTLDNIAYVMPGL
ncbi:CG4617 [Drosophila busckii]|uniref:CG4617 n=1 Tax=Drosophila busckii TaxID=30019 RepID=A0A0M4ETT7_DROBS|nr:HMG domain-containing protein 4 [Drosophila busckii]ALC48372.1 CG4617 [Drosophila busckii]